MSIDFWKKEMGKITDNREVLDTSPILNKSTTLNDKMLRQVEISSSCIDDYDRQNTLVKIQNNSQDKWSLYDNELKPLINLDWDGVTRRIQLGIGRNIIKLSKKEIEGRSFTKIITWLGNNYAEGHIETKALQKRGNLKSIFYYENLIADSSHILHRARKRYNFLIRDKPYYEDQCQQFQLLISRTQELHNKILTQIPNIINAALLEIEQEDRLFIQEGKQQYFESLNYIINNIYDGYNPSKQNGLRFSDETLISPLSKSWFESHELLQSFFINNGWYLGFEGSVGMRHPNFIEKALNDIETLQSYIIDNNSNIPPSPEKNWILNLNIASLRGRVVRVVRVGERLWNQNIQNQVEKTTAFNNVIANLSAHKVFSTMTHEMNVSGFTSDYLYALGDSHISEAGMKEQWVMACKGHFQSNVENFFDYRLQMGTDHLYQMHSGLALIYLHSCLSRLSKKFN